MCFLEEDVSYELSASCLDGERVVLVSDNGPMYFTGESIYLRRGESWYRVSVMDIKVILPVSGGGLELIMIYAVPGHGNLEIKLDSKKRGHMAALKHVLTIYKDRLAEVFLDE